MKKILITFLVIPQFVFGQCNFSVDIKKVNNGYLYTKECHKEIGKIVKQNTLRQEQIDELKKTITLKDLAVNTHIKRVDMWRDTSYNLENRIHKIQRWKKWNDWTFFAIGVLTTSAAVWGAGQLRK